MSNTYAMTDQQWADQWTAKETQRATALAALDSSRAMANRIADETYAEYVARHRENCTETDACTCVKCNFSDETDW